MGPTASNWIWAFLLLLGLGDRTRTEGAELPRTQVPGEECGGNVSVGSVSGFLRSPGYPGEYPGGLDCRWLLTSVRPDANITLRIHALDLEEDADCGLDYLQVYAGPDALSPALGPFCGRMRNATLRTHAPRLLLRFRSDPGSARGRRGFSLEHDARAGPGCDQWLGGSAGEFRSPGHPGNYPDGADCWVVVSAGPGRQVALKFERLDLEFDEQCALDYVRVFDGPTAESPPLGRACRGAPSFESTGDALLVHFHSDRTYGRTGFRARYEARDRAPPPEGGCLWQRDGMNGSVASPNFPGKYPELSDCALWLVAPEGSRVLLAFDAFRLEPADNCTADYLQIREGPVSDSRLLGTFCDSENEPGNLTSAGNRVQVIFHSDDAFQFSGFKFRYWFQPNQTDPKISRPDGEESITFDVVPQNATLAAGSSHVLDCRTNRPDAKIEWLKGAEPLSGLPGLRLLGNASLWIRAMDPHLSGAYACVATWRGREVSARAYVLLADDPDCGIVFRRAPSPATYAEGESAQLECAATGPGGAARTSWEREGRPLRAAPPRLLLLRGGALLHLERLALADAGLYACRARDPLRPRCQRRASALLAVRPAADLERVCGRPRLGRPSEQTPQEDHGKIIGGSDAKEGAHPWQAMLWEPGLGSFCGGTLLSERWVATAAHCFVNYRNLRWERVEVRLGKHDRERDEAAEGEVRTGVADVVVHPAYKKRTFDNDLALVRLRDHVALSERVLPACLGLGGAAPAAGAVGTVTGWGRLKEGGPSPRFLQEIRMPVVDRDTCLASTNYTVSRNMFCAGYAQEIIGDACHGDSGGPFVVRRDGRWHLAGVVSWGEGCGQPGKYGFYTRVSEYLPWIRGIVRS